MDIDYRYAEGDTTRLKALAQELIALKPDVVWASAPSPVVAVKSIAPDFPVVCPQISDFDRAGPRDELRTAGWQRHGCRDIR